MKLQVTYLWNIQYYYEPGCPQLKVTMPTQVKAISFDEAKVKVELFLKGLEFPTCDKVRLNGLNLAGACPLE